MALYQQNFVVSSNASAIAQSHWMCIEEQSDLRA